MKILLCSFWALPHVGGMSTYVDLLKQGLENLGHHVDVYATSPTDWDIYYMTGQSKMVSKQFMKKIAREKSEKYFQTLQEQMESYIRVTEIQRHYFAEAFQTFPVWDYDIIHSQDVLSTLSILSVKNYDIPLVSTLHSSFAAEQILINNIQSNSQSEKYCDYLERLGVMGTHATIVPSDWFRSSLNEQHGINLSHIVKIPHGIDLRSFNNEMQRPLNLTLPNDKKLISCISRLSPEKGSDTLLNALFELKAQRSDWQCWIAGDGSERSRLEKMVQDLKLEKDVLFLGNRDDVPALLKASDIFVLPSKQEILGIAAIEALVAGKAMVLSDAGGLPEVVLSTNAGVIFPKGDSHELYITLMKILGDDQIQIQLEDAAKRVEKSDWSREAMVDRTLQVYRNAIHGELNPESDLPDFRWLGLSF